MRFDDIISISRRPDSPRPPTHRQPIGASIPGSGDPDPRRTGFVTGLIDHRHGQRLRPGRRGFLRGAALTAAAATAACFTQLFPTARRVAAQTGVVGTYPRRILQFCPPYNASDNCQPGCGSSPICTDCCGADGFFRNEPAAGYSLYPGGCGDGDIADGWIWRYQGVCGNCSTIEYRCSDGYVNTDTGPAPFICRVVTECVPLADGQEPGEALPDAAQSTSWRPAGSLELVVDNGGQVTMTGWITDGRSRPVDLRITSDGQIIFIGQASLARPDIASAVRGAGANSGFSLTFPADPGPHRFCVEALNGAIVRTISCVNLDVGTGQRIRGGTTAGDLGSAAAGNTPTNPTPSPGEVVVPDLDSPSPNRTHGSVQVIRRLDASTGFVSGWAGDPDVEDPAVIDVRVAGVSAALAYAELPRPDVAAAFPRLSPTTGFATRVPLPVDETRVCVEVIAPDDGRRRTLACLTVGAAIDNQNDGLDDAVEAAGIDLDASTRPTGNGTPEALPPVVWGELDEVELDGQVVTVRGWAANPNAPADGVEIEAVVTGGAHRGLTGLPHTTAMSRYGYDDAGFEFDFVVPIGSQTISVEAVLDGERFVLGRERIQT